MPVSGSKHRGGCLTRHGCRDWSSVGGGCVDAAGGKVSVDVPEGLEVVGGASLGGSSLGVVPCVMGGEATSVGEGKSVGVTRSAVTDGWGVSCRHVGGDGGRGWDECLTVPVARDGAGSCCGMEGWLVCKRVGSDDYAV